MLNRRSSLPRPRHACKKEIRHQWPPIIKAPKYSMQILKTPSLETEPCITALFVWSLQAKENAISRSFKAQRRLDQQP